MRLNFDYYHNLERVDLFLCNPDGRELFPLPGQKRNLTLRFNDLSELTFEVSDKATLSDGTEVVLDVFDYIQTKRLVYATNIGWFQITTVDEHDNGEEKSKTVTCESYQSVLKNKGFVSEERVYCFYNPNDPYDDKYNPSNDEHIPSVLGQWSKQLGIKIALGQGLAEPDEPYDDWTVTYIHSSLIYTGSDSICRTFKENTTYGYDWMVNDVENAFEVIVLFDFMYKTIHVMVPSEIAEKANVIYTFNNFMKTIEINESSEDIVTVLNCHGDNCDITAVNPTGTNYICDFSYFMDTKNYRWMSRELINKINEWKAACADKKDEYTDYVTQLRALYQQKTEKETVLQEMSLSLQDLRNAQNKRSVVGNGTPGALCGIVCAETVNSGSTSIKSGTDYSTSAFTGSSKITAYPYSPRYNTETKSWDFSSAGTPIEDTADAIVASNLSDSNTNGVSYWYFSDVSDNSSYCKLKSAVKVNKDEATSEYYCGGFERFIAYCYPTVDEGGITTYTDSVQSWINLRESIVNGLNKDLYGYANAAQSGFDADGHITITTSFVKDSDGDYIESKLPVTYTDEDGNLIESICYQINQLVDSINDITSLLNILSYFSSTPGLLRELNCYWIEGDYTNENIAVLEDTTLEKEIDLSNELLEAGYIELSKVCQPRFSFSVDSIDATKNYEFRHQMRELELGKIVTIEKEDGLWYYPALLEISMSLDNSNEFSMTFANAMRLDDWGYTYADLISDASSTSRQVSANWQDILAYAKEREKITSLIKDPLNATLRASFANMVNQDFIIDKSGLLGRKRVSETSDEFEKEQVRLINNLLIFTDDNWETAKTALGKIYYKDSSGNPITSYGLIAETIIGSLIMGEKLEILNKDSTVKIDGGGIIIKKTIYDDEGNLIDYATVFEATKDGTLTVTGYPTRKEVNGAVSEVSAKLDLYVLKTDNDQVVSMLNASADVITLNSNRLIINSTNFKLTANGTMTAHKGQFTGSIVATNDINSNNKTLINENGIYFGNSFSTNAPSYIGDSDYSINNEGGSWAMSNIAIYSAPTITSTTDAYYSGLWYLKGWTITPYQIKFRGSYNGHEGITMSTSGIKSHFMQVDRDKTTGSDAYLQFWGTEGNLRASMYMNWDDNYFMMYSWNHGIGIGASDHDSKLWGTWYGSLAGGSSRNIKKDIESLTDKHTVLFDNLIPRSFKFIDGESGRTHYGYVVDELKTAMDIAGLSSKECAAYCLTDPTNPDGDGGIRYDEIAVLATYELQKLKQRVAELEILVQQQERN